VIARSLVLVSLLLIACGCTRGGAAKAAPAETRVQEVKFDHSLFGRTRRVWVMTPAARTDSAGLLVVFDGPQYLDEIPLAPILDSLTAAGRWAPTVAVLVDNGTGPTRIEDLGNRTAFAAWLADELVPWARATYHLSHDPHKTAAYGSSAGGLAAAFVTFRRPDTFGVAISQSGAFWRNGESAGPPPWEWLTARVAEASRQDVRFVLDVGALETKGTLGGRGPSILDANRRLRDALQAKGYPLTYFEVAGGTHSPESWRERLPRLLAAAHQSAAP